MNYRAKEAARLNLINDAKCYRAAMQYDAGRDADVWVKKIAKRLNDLGGMMGSW